MAFEDLGKTFQRFGQGVGSKVQSFMAVQSANAKLSDAKKELEQSYSGLGKAAYEKLSGNPIEGLEDAFGAVKTSLGKLEALSDEFQRTKGVKLCPNCGREFPLEELYCSSCGTKLPDVTLGSESVALLPEASDAYVVPTVYGKVRGGAENG